ncbi:MAG: hypothetical protein R3B95_06835 [Nitrospirales bacterium]|nr:hypothetical protein [Nitrospirales bacterium]
MATQAIKLGEAHILVAGGMESMSGAPYLLTRARQGYRLGHGELIDSLIGLAFGTSITISTWVRVGNSAHQISPRPASSGRLHHRKLSPGPNGDPQRAFKREIVPVEVPQKKVAPFSSPTMKNQIAWILKKLASLKPVFKEDGVLTVGNSPSCNDGAATRPHGRAGGHITASSHSPGCRVCRRRVARSGSPLPRFRPSKPF